MITITCLQCGCRTAVPGTACPNCDEPMPDATQDDPSVCGTRKKVIRPAKVFHDPLLESHGIYGVCYKARRS